MFLKVLPTVAARKVLTEQKYESKCLQVSVCVSEGLFYDPTQPV